MEKELFVMMGRGEVYLKGGVYSLFEFHNFNKMA